MNSFRDSSGSFVRQGQTEDEQVFFDHEVPPGSAGASSSLLANPTPSLHRSPLERGSAHNAHPTVFPHGASPTTLLSRSAEGSSRAGGGEASSSSSFVPFHHIASNAPPTHHHHTLTLDQLTSLSMLPNDLRDRERLMKHITYLSSVVNRLQMEVNYYRQAVPQASGPGRGLLSVGEQQGDTALTQPQQQWALMAHDELQRRFDPIVAELQLGRLDNIVAQQSLLREADAQRVAAIEKEAEDLHQQVQQWKERYQESIDALHAAQQWEQVANGLETELAGSREEVYHLRRTERRLVSQMRKLRQQVGQVSPSAVFIDDDDDDEVSEKSDTDHILRRGPAQSPPPQPRYERMYVEMDEIAARQDLLVEELWFGPLLYALHMVVAYDTELQSFRDLNPQVPPQVFEDEQHQQAAMVHEAVNTSTALHQQQQATLAVVQELESLRQAHTFMGIQCQRMERLLEGERSRNELLAADHCKQLEQIHDHLAAERREYLDRVAVEVRHAFREGMMREKANRRARRAALASAAPGAQVDAPPSSDASSAHHSLDVSQQPT